MIIMSLNETELGLAVMEDDGWRPAITSEPEPDTWTITVRLTGVRAPTADSALNRISARLAGPEFGRTLQARAKPAHITKGT